MRFFSPIRAAAHLFLWLVGVTALSVALAAQKPGFEYTLDPSVHVGPFEVRKARDLKTSRWHVEILRGGTLLFRSSNGAKAEEDLLFGTFPLLGGEEKQIVIEEYTGDAFCCTYNYVLKASDNLNVLYSSTQYPVGYGLLPQDLDGDGVYELITTLTRFDNFFNLPHEASPSVRVVFRYDRESGRYVVANREFPNVVLADLEKDKEFADQLSKQRETGPGLAKWRSEFTGAVLNVTLGYIYAGRQQDGWIYLLGKYDLEDKEVLLANLRYYLLRCPVFRSVYKDANEVLRSRTQTNE